MVNIEQNVHTATTYFIARDLNYILLRQHYILCKYPSQCFKINNLTNRARSANSWLDHRICNSFSFKQSRKKNKSAPIRDHHTCALFSRAKTPALQKIEI